MPKKNRVLVKRTTKKLFADDGSVISEKVVEEYGTLVSFKGGIPGPMAPKGESA